MLRTYNLSFLHLGAFAWISGFLFKSVSRRLILVRSAFFKYFFRYLLLGVSKWSSKEFPDLIGVCLWNGARDYIGIHTIRWKIWTHRCNSCYTLGSGAGTKFYWYVKSSIFLTTCRSLVYKYISGGHCLCITSSDGPQVICFISYSFYLLFVLLGTIMSTTANFYTSFTRARIKYLQLLDMHGIQNGTKVPCMFLFPFLFFESYNYYWQVDMYTWNGMKMPGGLNFVSNPGLFHLYYSTNINNLCIWNWITVTVIYIFCSVCTFFL